MKKIVLILTLSFVGLFAFEQLTLKNFDEKIKNKNVIIDFYAPWCPPCKIISKNLEEFNKIKDKNIEIYKVNIDEQFDLAIKYGVKALPTLIFMKDKKILKKHIGILSVKNLDKESKEKF